MHQLQNRPLQFPLGAPLAPSLQVRYVNQWEKQKANKAFLDKVFGLKDFPQKCFLKGVLFAPSSSKHLAPLLQDVIQADSAHSNFGKYFVFSIQNKCQ